MSDIRHFSSLEIKFELGTPFLPFEQLLAVLPAASRQLLPKPFQVRIYQPLFVDMLVIFNTHKVQLPGKVVHHQYCLLVFLSNLKLVFFGNCGEASIPSIILSAYFISYEDGFVSSPFLT